MNGSASAADGQFLQHFRDQDEEQNDERCEILADGERGHQGDGHGKFHGHAARQQVRNGLLEDRIAADQGRG